MKTKIHGKSYDLRNFKHPGGNISINLCDGKDGTALFESYHPVSDRQMLNRILAKYEIPNDPTIQADSIYDYTLFNDDFTKELRTQVYSYFKNLAHKNKCSLITATKMPSYGIPYIFMLLFFLYNLYNYTIFLLPFSYWLLFVNTWHDAGHFALFRNKTLESFVFSIRSLISSPKGWLSRHTYQHHSYPNIVNLDKDINSIIDKKLLTKIKNNRKLMPIFLILHFVTYMILSKLFFFIVKTEIHMIIFLLIFALFTQVNHIHTENFTGSSHFYKHQIITATNIKTDSYLLRILSGGLNCQIEHHLFPSVNSCHLPEIAKIVKPLCIKYNIPYNEYSSFSQALSDTYTTSKKLTSKTISDYNFITYK